MNRIFLFATIIIAAACEPKPNYEASTYLDVKEKSRIHLTIVRNIGKMPDNADSASRMDKEYDTYFLELASKHQLKQYFVAENGEQFFLEWRPAPSLQEKYVATGGKFRVDSEGAIIAFEEIFRTWKMHPDTLARRGFLLFDKMVKGESLKPFETTNSNGIEFIEFPDANVFYDKASRQWKSRQFESVEEMVQRH